ncbi:MAG: DNA repair protein RadA [Candidatus Hydrogenedentota bacterium]|nr:MAG: DNA repair protein RadA [Candidatus Hydrogenedentota bacterium]
MSRKRTNFICSDCQTPQPRWYGRCPACGSWNTLHPIEEFGEQSAANSPPSLIPLREVTAGSHPRRLAPHAELNRVLGGGFVAGGTVLIAGDPGIGKSTLALQTAAGFGNVLYVCGEESPSQLKLRAERLGLADAALHLIDDTRADAIEPILRSTPPEFVVVDSVQTLNFSQSLRATGFLGSVSRIRETSSLLIQAAKAADVTLLLIGHVTKGGDVAGPMALEHLVDTVLVMEQDVSGEFRLLRATKNRFGPTDMVGLFRMTESGLEDVSNPSEILLPRDRRAVPGAAVTASLEGKRPLLVELQALTVKTTYGMPKRVSTGIDPNRLSMLLAVLERKAGLSFSQHDVYLNSAGGFRLRETATDLGVAAATASSLRNLAVPPDTLFCGEISLSGEIRPVSRLGTRLAEAAGLGFRRAVVPYQPLSEEPEIAIHPVRNIEDLLCRLPS